MRRKVLLGVALITASTAGSGSAAVILNNNILTNGQLSNTTNPFVTNAAGLPTSWTAFGAGGIVIHAINGGTSNRQFALRGEPGAPETSGDATAGDAVRFGGGTVANADHGIYQIFNTTPGNLYYFFGTLNTNTSITAGNFNGVSVGLINSAGNQNITPPRAMEVSPGSAHHQLGIIVTGTGLGGNRNMGQRAFWNARVATGTQMSARVGIRGMGGIAGSGTNVAVDGLRVVEYDMTPTTTLINGGFETNTNNIANWGADAGAPAAGAPREFNGWAPLGGNVTDTGGIFTTAGDGGGTAVLLDQFQGSGRQMFVQRVDGLNAGPGSLYTLTGRVNPFSGAADADARIGIDPTGGLDPASPTVIWSSAAAANGTWQTLSIPTVTDVAGNGVTVFIAAGYDGPNARGASAGAAFDNIALTIVPVPEPGTFTVAGIAAVGVLATRRRRRRVQE